MAEQDERIEPNGYGDYKRFEQKNEFSHDLGVVVLPVAQRTSAHKKIRLHGGYAKRVVRWQADRTGRPPMVPAASDTQGDTLLSATFTPRLPTPNMDGPGYDWSCSGEYVYIQNTPRVVGENTFPVGQYPFLHLPAAEYATEVSKQYLNSYYISPSDPNVNRLENLMEQMATVIPVQSDGQWTWPFLAMPSLFSSTHLIGG